MKDNILSLIMLRPAVRRIKFLDAIDEEVQSSEEISSDE